MPAIQRANWIDPTDTREFEFSDEDYTLALTGVYGWIKPNERAASVTKDGQLMTIKDPGIIDAYLRYCGEKIYLIILYSWMACLAARAVFRSHSDIERRGDYPNWVWNHTINNSESTHSYYYYWYTANFSRPDRVQWSDSYWNRLVSLDENLSPPIERVFPLELALYLYSKNLPNVNLFSCTWQATNFLPLPSPIPWNAVQLSGQFDYENSYRYKNKDNGDPFPAGDEPRNSYFEYGFTEMPRTYKGHLLNKEVARSIGYKFRLIQQNPQIKEAAIELEFGQLPPCDIPITVDPQFRDTGHFCMSYPEYNTLMTRFPQMNQNINTTNNLLRESL